jgi:hypothetical protein
MTGASASDVPGPTGLGQGNKDDMHAGVHKGIPSLAAATMAERRLSVFKKALHRAADRVSPTRNPESHNKFLIGTAAAHKAAMFLEFAEPTRYRSVLKASARGRRVS